MFIKPSKKKSTGIKKDYGICKFSPDAKKIACVTPCNFRSSPILVVDVDNDKKLEITGPKNVESICWSPNGKHIAVGNYYDSGITIFDLTNYKKHKYEYTGGCFIASSICWNPNGKYIVVGKELGKMNIWVHDEENNVCCYKSYKKKYDSYNLRYSAIKNVCFTPCSRYFAATTKHTIIIWELDENKFKVSFGPFYKNIDDPKEAPCKKICELKGHTGRVNDLCFISRDNTSYLISASDDGTARIWNFKKNEEVTTLECIDQRLGGVVNVCYNASSKLLITIDSVGTLKIWNLMKNFKTIYKTRVAKDLKIKNICWNPSNENEFIIIAYKAGEGICLFFYNIPTN